MRSRAEAISGVCAFAEGASIKQSDADWAICVRTCACVLAWCGTAFKRLFLEKTKNAWADRRAFVKQPGGFQWVEMDYGGSADGDAGGTPAAGASGDADVACTLPAPVQELVRLIFDVNSIKQVCVPTWIGVRACPCVCT
jgi:hypothetical protein